MPIIVMNPHTPEWHEIRQKHVGASDVSALFGMSPYKTKRELWLEKAGKAKEGFQEDSCTLFGKMAEPAIAEVVDFEKKWKVNNFSGYVTHPTVNGMGCTPDYEIAGHERGRGLLEIKNVGHFSYQKRWIDNNPPADFELQVQHQLACCQHLGYTWGALAAWVSGQYLRVIEYEIRPKTITILENAVQDFWESVEKGIEPLEEKAS